MIKSHRQGAKNRQEKYKNLRALGVLAVLILETNNE
jgi:hypothetical protein